MHFMSILACLVLLVINQHKTYSRFTLQLKTYMYSKTSFQENEENRYFTLQLSKKKKKKYIYIYIHTLIRNMIRNVGRGWRLSEFKVEEGKKLFVHRMQNAEIGSKIELEKVLLIDNDGNVTVGVPTVEGAKVEAEVLAHVRGEKVLVFHKKRRKGYRKLNGHRQNFTQLKINKIVA